MVGRGSHWVDPGPSRHRVGGWRLACSVHDGYVPKDFGASRLSIVHRSAVKDRPAATNQFHALVVSAPAGIRADLQQMPLTQRIARVRRWRERDGDDVVARASHQALGRIVMIRRLSDERTRAYIERGLTLPRHQMAAFRRSRTPRTTDRALTRPLPTGRNR